MERLIDKIYKITSVQNKIDKIKGNKIKQTQLIFFKFFKKNLITKYVYDNLYFIPSLNKGKIIMNFYPLTKFPEFFDLYALYSYIFLYYFFSYPKFKFLKKKKKSYQSSYVDSCIECYSNINETKLFLYLLLYLNYWNKNSIIPWKLPTLTHNTIRCNFYELDVFSILYTFGFNVNKVVKIPINFFFFFQHAVIEELIIFIRLCNNFAEN